MPTNHTEYLILGRVANAGENTWMVTATGIIARSTDGAIRAYLTDREISEGEFVAVPARSWNPRKVTVESVPRVVLA